MVFDMASYCDPVLLRHSVHSNVTKCVSVSKCSLHDNHSQHRVKIITPLKINFTLEVLLSPLHSDKLSKNARRTARARH